jgi:aryl-alcohol dehydrogenase-like predicted oxidoreductase
MQQRNLGRSGLLVSTVGLGCNNFGARCDLEATRKVVHKALDAGITLFDTADRYGEGLSERYLGEALGVRRKEVVLATKFGLQLDPAGRLKGASRRYVMTAVEASLKRLGTDWIDLYQLHMPDPLTPIEETLRALDDLVRQGKVRYVGCSNLPAWQVVEAEWTARHHGLTRFISCQDEYSLVVRRLETDLAPVLASYGLGLLPYFPLAGGLLSGKYRSDAPAPEDGRLTHGPAIYDRFRAGPLFDTAQRLRGFASERGHTLLELAFSWLAARPGVASVIAGATTPEQVEQNARAVDWSLNTEDLVEIDRLSREATG